MSSMPITHGGSFWKNARTLQTTTDDHLASGINAVDLEHRFGDVETDCRDRLHVRLLRIVGALTAPTSWHSQEPSTASQAIIPLPPRGAVDVALNFEPPHRDVPKSPF